MPRFTIHIFNPETDYALAAGDCRYTPPAKIQRLIQDMCLFPANWAQPGDIVAFPDSCTPRKQESERKIIESKGIEILNFSQTAGFAASGNYNICPWGWNHSLRRELESCGWNPALLKSTMEIDALRELSHRRTTMGFYEKLTELRLDFTSGNPIEINDDGLAYSFLENAQGPVWFKMPWSSSGRGVVRSDSMRTDLLCEWIHGSIKRQGSVMAERHIVKTIDFASEWDYRRGKARLEGLSLFCTSSDGRYGGNEHLTQESIRENIRGKLNQPLDMILACQAKALEAVAGMNYNGPVGIDMMADTGGNIVPCVELNFRMTMGMAAMRSARPAGFRNL